MATVNDRVADAAIAHRLQLLRFEAGTARALVGVYDAALSDVLAEFARLVARAKAAGVTAAELSPVQAARLLAVRDNLDAKLREAQRLADLTLTQRLEEAGRAERAFQSGRMADAVGLSGWASVPEVSVLAAIIRPIGGQTYAAVIAKDLFEAREAVRAGVARALATGASMPKAAGILRATSGLVETYRGRFVAIARTEVQRVANEVAMMSYQRNADVIDAVQWLATLDSRTCLVCAPLHNTVYPMDGGQPIGLPTTPPVHPRCRCFLAPVVKDLAALGVRVKGDPRGYDGRPAEDTTFDAWLSRQPAATQDEILGPTRAALWRGGTPLERFSDGRRPLRLDELSPG